MYNHEVFGLLEVPTVHIITIDILAYSDIINITSMWQSVDNLYYSFTDKVGLRLVPPRSFIFISVHTSSTLC